MGVRALCCRFSRAIRLYYLPAGESPGMLSATLSKLKSVVFITILVALLVLGVLLITTSRGL